MSKRHEGVSNCVIAGFKYAVPSEHRVAAQAEGQLSHASDRRVKSSLSHKVLLCVRTAEEKHTDAVCFMGRSVQTHPLTGFNNNSAPSDGSSAVILGYVGL